jgi:site-specific DNA recombinase
LSRAKPIFFLTNGDQLDGDELFPAEQARIVALLIERVDIGADGLNVRLRVDGLNEFAREMLAGGIGEAA